MSHVLIYYVAQRYCAMLVRIACENAYCKQTELPANVILEYGIIGGCVCNV